VLVLRQIVGDIVVVAFVRHMDVNPESGVRRQIECAHGDADPVMLSRSSGSQKRDEPHAEQNPRRAFSDERNQLSFSSLWTVKAARGTSVDAKK